MKNLPQDWPALPFLPLALSVSKKLQGPKAPDQDSEEKCHLVIRDRLFCYALWRLTPSAGENHYHKNDNDEGRFGCSPPRLCSARTARRPLPGSSRGEVASGRRIKASGGGTAGVASGEPMPSLDVPALTWGGRWEACYEHGFCGLCSLHLVNHKGSSVAIQRIVWVSYEY